MKRLLLICALLCPFVCAQTSQSATDYTANRIAFPLLDGPQPVRSAIVTVAGNPGPATYYYWIVTQSLAGASSPSGPFQVSNAPGSLSASNFNAISWSAVLGALNYDVLRTATPSMPSGNCTCAVALAIPATSVSDQANALNSYTVNTLNAATLRFTITNESVSQGVSNLNFRVNGASVAALTSQGTFNFALPATVVQTNQSNSFTTGTQSFISASALIIPRGAGLQPGTQGSMAFDVAAQRYGGGASSGYQVFVTPASTDTLTNKTLSGTTIAGGTITGTLQNNGTLGGLTPSVQTFTSSGTFTIPPGVTAVKVTVVASGGNGTSLSSTAMGGGGGSGSAAIKWLSGLTSGNTLTVTAGGAGQAWSVSSGTQSITTLTANPGQNGGVSGPVTVGGAGGSPGSGGDLNLGGNPGANSNPNGSGAGAGSIFGGGGPPQTTNPANGIAGTAPGAGGSGANSSGALQIGGQGALGIVIFEWVK